MVGEVGSRLISFAFNLVLARGLGTEGFGRYSYAYAFAGLIALSGELGLNTYLTREVARDRDNAPSFARAFLPLRLLMVGLVAVISVLLAWRLTDPSRLAEIALMACFAGLNTLLDCQGCLLSAFEKMGHDAGLRVTTRVVVALAGIGAVLAGAPLLAVMAAVTGANLLALLIGEAWRRRIGFAFGLSWEPRRMARMLVDSVPVGITAFTLSVYFYMDAVVLAALGLGDSQIGQYAAASKILEASQGLPLVVAAGLFPIAAQLGRAGDAASLAPFFTRVNRVCLLLGAPAAAVAAVIAPAVARLLYGAGYELTGPVLSLLAVAAPVFYSNLVAAHMLLAMGRHWEAALLRGGAGALKLALTILAGRKLGVLGAAAALLATDLVLFAVLYVRRRAGGLSEPGEGRLIAACLAASACSLAAWHWSSSAPLWVTAPAVAVPFLAWLGARRFFQPRPSPVAPRSAAPQ